MKKKLLIFSMILLVAFALVIPKTNALTMIPSTYTPMYYKHNPSFKWSPTNTNRVYIDNLTFSSEIIQNPGTYYIDYAPKGWGTSSSPSTNTLRFFVKNVSKNNKTMYQSYINQYNNYGEGFSIIFKNMEFEEISPCYLKILNPSSFAYRYQVPGGDITDFVTITATQYPAGSWVDIGQLLNYGTFEYVEFNMVASSFSSSYISYVDDIVENPLNANININITEEVVPLDFSGWIISIFTSFAAFLSIQIGDVTIGAILLIPLILSIVFVILKLFRGGGD